MNRSVQAVRANDVRNAIGPPRKTNRASAASDPQLAAFEKQLAVATNKRDALKAELDKLEGNRDLAIENAITHSQDHVEKQTGLSAQLNALGALTHDDPKILLILIPCIFVSLMLELGPMICAATYIPSAYAARVVLAHFTDVAELAEAGAKKLGASEADHGKTDKASDAPAIGAVPPVVPAETPKEPNTKLPNISALDGSMPAKRTRGPYRTRKKASLDEMNTGYLNGGATDE